MPFRRIAICCLATLLPMLVGCCCGSGACPLWPASGGGAVPYTTAQGAVVRQQSPDESESGLFKIPSLAQIKESRVFNGFRKIMGTDLNEPLAREQFRQAEELFRAGNYAEAAKMYRKAANHWPESALEEDALYMRGEAMFFTDRYPKASESYLELLEKYENSRHLDKAVNRQFAIARYWQELERQSPGFIFGLSLLDKTRPWFDTDGEARKNYESIRLHDPTGPLADDSIMATANGYFLDDNFDQADYYYSLLRSEYPKSEHLMEAYKLGLRSKLSKYGGPQYESTPLFESEELIDQMLTQYPTELADDRERIVQAGRAVRAQLAERDWEMGEYYHRRKYFQAASLYYDNILKEYGETQFAELARNRIVEIKDEPPSPPQRFGWIDKIVPEPGKRRR